MINLSHDNFRVYLDVNVFETLTAANGERFYNGMSRSTARFEGARVLESLIVGPMWLLEMCGVGNTIPGYDDASDLQRKFSDKMNGEDLKTVVFLHYQKRCQQWMFETKGTMEKSVQNRQSRASESGKAIYESIWSKYLSSDEDFRFLADMVALDRTYGFPYPPQYRKTVVPALMVDPIRATDHFMEVSAARGVQTAFYGMSDNSDTIMRMGIPRGEAREYQIRMHALASQLRFRSIGDLIDSELIHYAVLGAKGNVDVRCATVCFSMDSIDTLGKRARAYYDFVKMGFDSDKKARESRKQVIPHPRPKMSRGAIAQVAADGSLVKVVRIGDLPNLKLDEVTK